MLSVLNISKRNPELANFPLILSYRISRYETENAQHHHYDGRYYASSKRDLNVPSLGLHNVAMKETPTAQHISGKMSLNEALGYRSERVNGDTALDFLTQYNSSEPERHNKGISSGSANDMNVYLYKNFNKFIQNFYVKNEQASKNKALENRIKEKFSNNPYQKELLAAKTKKVLVTKKTPTPSTASTIPRQTYSKTPTFTKGTNLSPNERYAYDEDIKKIESRRPKTGSKRPTEEIPVEFIRKMNPAVNLRISEKLVKPFNVKDLDSLKGSFSVKRKDNF